MSFASFQHPWISTLQQQALSCLNNGAPTVQFELPVLQLAAGLVAVCLLVAAVLRRASRQRQVYVLDFAVHKPHDSWLFPRSNIRAVCEKRQFPDEEISFQAMWRDLDQIEKEAAAAAARAAKAKLEGST